MTRWPALAHAAFSLLILAGGWLLPAVPEVEGRLGAALEFSHEHGPHGEPEYRAGAERATEVRFEAVLPFAPCVAALDRAGDDGKGRLRVASRRGGDRERRSPFRREPKAADRSPYPSTTPRYLEIRSFLC